MISSYATCAETGFQQMQRILRSFAVLRCSGFAYAASAAQDDKAATHVGAYPLHLRFLRRFRLASAVERDRLANERLESGCVHLFSFVDVDRAAYVSLETRVE